MTLFGGKHFSTLTGRRIKRITASKMDGVRVYEYLGNPRACANSMYQAVFSPRQKIARERGYSGMFFLGRLGGGGESMSLEGMCKHTLHVHTQLGLIPPPQTHNPVLVRHSYSIVCAHNTGTLLVYCYA